jgi:hypothetical protein
MTLRDRAKAKTEWPGRNPENKKPHQAQHSLIGLWMLVWAGRYVHSHEVWYLRAKWIGDWNGF